MTKTILVVEDEALLRSVVAETLADAGYYVLEAADGRAGLEMVKSQSGIALMISDIKMPGLNGYELTQAALAVKPELKVLLVTGYANGPAPEPIRNAGIPILHKPFDFEKLTELVGTTLGAP